MGKYKQNQKNVINSLHHDFIRVIELDSRGRIWIVLTGHGLEMFDPRTKTFTHFQDLPPGQLVSKWIRDIHIDSRDRIWLAYEGGGVCLYDSQKNTLMRNHLFYSDNSSRLWGRSDANPYFPLYNPM